MNNPADIYGPLLTEHDTEPTVGGRMAVLGSIRALLVLAGGCETVIAELDLLAEWTDDYEFRATR